MYFVTLLQKLLSQQLAIENSNIVLLPCILIAFILLSLEDSIPILIFLNNSKMKVVIFYFLL